jgi:hypothetical protein
MACRAKKTLPKEPSPIKDPFIQFLGAKLFPAKKSARPSSSSSPSSATMTLIRSLNEPPSVAATLRLSSKRLWREVLGGSSEPLSKETYDLRFGSMGDSSWSG